MRSTPTSGDAAYTALPIGYTTDFDGEFSVTPPLAAEHRAHLEAFDGADIAALRDPNLPHSECHWKPLDPVGIAFGWDGCERFTEYRAWLVYLIEHFLSPWGYRLDGAVTWQGEDEDDRGVIVVEANQASVLGFRRPWPESEPSHSRYWPPERQARLLAGRRAGADEYALATELETWPSLIRARLRRFGSPGDVTRTLDDYVGMGAIPAHLADLLRASPVHATAVLRGTAGEEPSGAPALPRRAIAVDPDLLARREQALAEARAKRARLLRERAERSDD